MILKYDVLQLLDEYEKNFGNSWRSAQADSTQPWPYLDQALIRFQVPPYFFIVSASAKG